MKLAVYKRRYITLIEVMIVMFLIALITGVLAYNYRGALDEGKAFKTKAGIDKLETILNLKASEDPSFLGSADADWIEVLKSSPMVKDPDSLAKDGWGEYYQVSVHEGVIHVSSRRYEQYLQTHKESMFKK